MKTMKKPRVNRKEVREEVREALQRSKIKNVGDGSSRQTRRRAETPPPTQRKYSLGKRPRETPVRKTPPTATIRHLFESPCINKDAFHMSPPSDMLPEVALQQLGTVLGSLNKYCKVVQDVSSATTILKERVELKIFLRMSAQKAIDHLRGKQKEAMESVWKTMVDKTAMTITGLTKEVEKLQRTCNQRDHHTFESQTQLTRAL